MKQFVATKMIMILSAAAVVLVVGIVAGLHLTGNVPWGGQQDQIDGDRVALTTTKDEGQKDADAKEAMGLLQLLDGNNSQQIIHCSYDIIGQPADLQRVELYIKDSQTLIGHQGDHKANMLIKDGKAYIWDDGSTGIPGIVVDYGPGTNLERELNNSEDFSGILTPQALIETAESNGQNSDMVNLECAEAKGVDDTIFSKPNGVIFNDASSFDQ